MFFDLDSQKASVSASIGITCFPADGDEPNDIMKKADQAMYAAKRAGRNAFVVYSEDCQKEAPAVPYVDTEVFRQAPVQKSNHSLKQFGFAIAAALAVVALASVWMTSMSSKDDLKVAIEKNLETLSDFGTASGPED